ncbi:MAG: hypothetical protein U1E76_17115 [Planctomycetota bacterium]
MSMPHARPLCLSSLLLAAACSLIQRHPEPKPGMSQILVEVKALPKTGIKPPQREPGSGYGGMYASVEEDWRYRRVDYADLQDVVVLLEGGALPGPAPPHAPRLVAAREHDLITLDHDQVLIAPDGRLELHNRTDRPLHFYSTSEAWHWLELTVPPASGATAAAPAPGQHELLCEEDEALKTTVVCAPCGAVARSGDELLFDDLPPGEYRVLVIAPRLPAFAATVKTRAGERTTVAARLTVNDLPSGRAGDHPAP